MSTTTTTSGGISFCSALFLLFLGLRLTGNIDWAWYWIASPLLAMPALIVALLFIGGLAYTIGSMVDEIWSRRRFNKAGEAPRSKRN